MTKLNSLICPNDNPNLTEERIKATFDTNHLAAIFHGGYEKVKRRREIVNYVKQHPELHDSLPVEFMSREERFENINRKLLPWMKHMKNAVDINNPEEMKYFENLVMGTDGHPLGIHFIMGIPAILNNADDEQLKQWLPKVMNNEYVLAYAQTELGHGTNLKNLETTAIFDSKTQEFVLNSPTITSTKWWPGNLGKSSNWSIVMAQLIIGKKNYGPHPFFVQIRDSETHEPLPRLSVGDIGPKFELNSNDNGFLRFDNFRIPRTSLMMKHAKVLPDGTYVPAIHPKLGYLTMIVVRAAVVTVASEYLSKACVIATRYSAIRRQGEIIPG
uniref:Acyl-coenzyme A oxidase N-terminal domain-containing protein n=1 Tax=Panagrolaimus sp. JU765 TaxID=591449 RepID=A0AC34R2N2_9BILA